MASSPRALWKGAISFGLVHIPVGLYPASGDSGIDFDWLDKRTLDPVGYRRINKRTGREITRENIVRGVAHGKGKYVVLSDQEIAAAYPRSTQLIEIEAFVPLADIPLVYYDRPYYLGPINKGEKVYALLREALQDSGRGGLARVVIQTRQHLSVVVPSGPALVLHLLRWSADLRDYSSLGLPKAGARAAGLEPKQQRMAEQLVASMSAPFKPESFEDRFHSQVMSLVERKARAGKSHTVEAAEQAPPTGADIIDLTELLKRSLGGKSGAAGKPPRRKRAA